MGRNEDDGYQLWTTDGTEAGTAITRVITLGGSRISNLAAHGGWLWFCEDDYVHGPELYASNGTAAGTQLVADAVAGEGGLSPIPLEVLAGEGRAAIAGAIPEVLFAGEDPTHGLELWRTDGSAAGTKLVVDLWPGVPPGILTRDL